MENYNLPVQYTEPYIGFTIYSSQFAVSTVSGPYQSGNGNTMYNSYIYACYDSPIDGYMYLLTLGV